MNMDAFIVAISIIFICLLVAAIVMWLIDSRLTTVRRSTIAKKMEEGKGLRLEGDNIYLHVEDGLVTLCTDLPAAAHVEEPKVEAEAPVAPITLAETVAAPVAEEVAEEPKAESYEVLAAEEDEAEEAVTLAAEEEAPRATYVELTDRSVVFDSNKNDKKTFADKLAELSPEKRALYDEFVAYVLENADCRKSESSTAATFKCKTDKMLRVFIKRGTVELHFILINADFKRFIRETGVKTAKINPVLIRLVSEEELTLAKQTADITISSCREEQEYRKQQRREMRRKKAAAEK